MDETLVNFGSEIKVLGETDDAWRVGGWAVIFDSHDASNLRDKFTKSTDFDFEAGEARSLYYNHGLDGTIKKTRLGRATLEVKDAGIWYSGEVKKRSDYLKAHAQKIIEGIKNGIYGTSTGAPAHLVERKSVDGGHEITMWPLSEISITPCPAEPLTSCISLKSLIEIEAGDELKDVLDSGSYAPEVKPSPKVATMRDKFRSGEMDDVCPDCGGEIEDGKCEACGYEVEKKSAEVKKYDPRQPRDDHGKWSSGPGGSLSVGHAIHVMRSEGIHDEAHHESVRKAIENGAHKTREDVLAHIDSIHAVNGTKPPKSDGGSTSKAPKVASKPLHEMTVDEMAAHIESNPHLIEYEEKDKNDPYAIGRYRSDTGASSLVFRHNTPHEMAGHILQQEKIQKNKKDADDARTKQFSSLNPKPLSEETRASLAQFSKLKQSERYDVASAGKSGGTTSNPDHQHIADALAEAHAGHTYTPPKEGADPKFSKNTTGWMPVTEEGYVTNTHVLIKGDYPKTAPRNERFVGPDADGVAPNSTKLWPKKDGAEIKPHVEAAAMETDAEHVVYMSNGARFNKQYIDLVLSRYPDATFHEGSGGLSPAVVKSGGERVGLVMPMAPDERHEQKLFSRNTKPAQKSLFIVETDTPEFKTLTELSEGLRGDSSFSEFPAKVRGAVAGAVKHIEEMTDARCVKSNRRWSETVHGELLTLRDELKSATETIEALADAHAPRSKEVEQAILDAILLETRLTLQDSAVLTF